MLWDVSSSVQLPVNRLVSNRTFPLRDVLLYPNILPSTSFHICPFIPFVLQLPRLCLAKGSSSWSLNLEVAMEQLYHIPEQLWLGGLSTTREMRYLNMSRIFELAQQGETYLCQAILGFFKPFAGYCLRKHLCFPLSGVFSLCFFSPLILHFPPFPSLSCLFPPLLLFLELLVLPRQL